MRNVTKIIGFGAACAACCAVPLAAPLLAGTFAGSALFGFGAEALEWIAGLTALGLAAFLLRGFMRAPRTAACAADTGCGCPSARRLTPPVEQVESASIACTLTQRDFKERVRWIRNLARGSLREARREPLALHLRYDTAAAVRVREMVRKEEACCAFLHFDLREDAGGVHLSITAPEEAREAANELFAHFAPELARSQQSLPSPQKESAL